VPITAQDMLAYIELTGRVEQRYRHQILRLIPPLDRHYLRHFYDRQKAEMDKAQKKSKAASSRR
jgi:hypothetical protein